MNKPQKNEKRKDKKMKKTVEFSYPTSNNANKFGFKEGCYCVELIPDNGYPKAIAAYKTEREAIDHAHSLDYPWSFCWLHAMSNYQYTKGN